MNTRDLRGVVYLQELIGREVVDHRGHKLGRVWECLAEPEGDQLCVSALVVGPRAWAGRYGSADHATGSVIPWEEIDALSPRIVVRRVERR